MLRHEKREAKMKQLDKQGIEYNPDDIVVTDDEDGDESKK